ncbi:ABC transporter permease [Micromonospora krabiensis]|uniref:Putative ABC transport system permease protein n=1 Tax=Micromonospora krabiensis TaxID=307121 RepID=A0A1C3N3X6_9ACTN|nr:ABC transporter permease [Micromonospora krabiensis]SBV27302.1 putative ABC transport system permease protein [Micromonospora krabiensis]
MTLRPGVRFRRPTGARLPSRPGRKVPPGAGRPAGRPRRVAELVGSWRAALRIARREARRARGRTALVLAMITLPVLALSFLAASYDMAKLTREERIDRQLGAADAVLRWTGDVPVVQDRWGESWYTQGGATGPTPGRPVTTAEVEALLGPGARAVNDPLLTSVTFRVGDRDASVPARTLDLGDPLARGTGRLLAGRAPAAPDEIAASPAALRRLDVRLDGTVTTVDGSATLRVVGLVEFPDDLGPLVVRHPSTASATGPDEGTTWLVDLPGGVHDDLVRRLNDRGILVSTRAGEDDQAGPHLWPAGDRPTDVNDLGTGVLVGGLGLLEVVLLVGPAFAVGVRRRRRDLALVAVAGGDAAQLRRVVLADGVVLGCVGAVTGVVLGVAAAFAARPLVEQYANGARYGGYRCWPAALVVIAGIAVLAGVLAALAPAWSAARQDVVAGLSGRRSPPRHRHRWLALGLTLAVGGAGIAALGATRPTPVVILAGLILGELGLVFCTPTLIGLLARVGRTLPLAPRIALRDASRNRAAAAPAISAVMAAVAGSVALGAYLASDQARAAAAYQPTLPSGNVLVSQLEPNRPAPSLAQVTEAARDHLDARAVAAVAEATCDPARGPATICDVSPLPPPEQVCPWRASDVLSAGQRRQARADPRCEQRFGDYYGPYVQVLVDDGSALPILTGATPGEAAAAAATLRAGGVVVTDARQVRDGRVAVAVDRGDDVDRPPARTVSVLAGYALPVDIGPDRLVLSPATADRLGLGRVTTAWAVATPTTPDRTRINAFTRALRPSGTVAVTTEPDRPPDRDGPLPLLLAAAAGLITVGAAGIATGLAAAEGRADLSTLAAVGASPGVRRMLSLCQAGVIAGLGSALGIVAGLGTAALVLFSTNRQYADSWPVQEPYPLVVPWTALGVLALVPLVTMLGAGLFTRSRLPVERRLD